MLFRPSRGIRRDAQDELAFRDPHAVYAGIDLKLHQVVHLRQPFGTKIDLFPGSDRTKEFHAPDRRKKKQRLWHFGVTRRRRDAGRLRERLGQDDAGNQWIIRKMTGEDRIIREKRRCGLRESTRITLDQFAHEDKWRSMRQTEKRPTGLDRHTKFFLSAIRFPKSDFPLSRSQNRRTSSSHRHGGCPPGSHRSEATHRRTAAGRPRTPLSLRNAPSGCRRVPSRARFRPSI